MPLSSPQKITPFAALAYRTMAGYYRRSQPRVLLIGAPHRLLRGEALARQVFAHRAHRKESRKRSFEALGACAADQAVGAVAQCQGMSSSIRLLGQPLTRRVSRSVK